MTGNPLWDFIAFDQLFNGDSSGGSSGGGDDNAVAGLDVHLLVEWALIITVIIFVLIFILSC